MVLQGECSCWLPVEAGVPQGSILGPLLFLVYINDLVDNISCDIRIFADDTSVFDIVHNPAVSARRMNRDLKIIFDWGKLWCVTFNANKSLSVLFSAKRNKKDHPPLLLGEDIIPEVSSHTHLGITLSSNLAWKSHIERVISKASKRPALLKRLKFKLSRKTLTKLYLCMVRPILEYGCTIFDNCGVGLTNALEAVQFEAARICTGALRHTSRVKLLSELGWSKLSTRRQYFKLIMFYKNFHKLCPTYLSDLVPTVERTLTLRNSSNVRQLKCRTNRYSTSFLPSTISLWNNLPLDLRNATPISKFKLHLKQTLLTTDKVPPYYSFGNRFANICQTQLRLGYTPLNQHLFQINAVPSPLCKCGDSEETVDHFFIYCPLFDAQRLKLLTGIRYLMAPGLHPLFLVHLAPRHLIDIFLYGSPEQPDCTNEAFCSLVQTYIIETKRFVY